MADEQVVSDEQLEANKMHKARKAWAKVQHVASRFPNPLVESRPLRDRPSRSRNAENNIERRPVGESRTGGEDAKPTHIAKASQPAPQVEPQVVDVAAVEENAEAEEHAKRVEAGKKAAATRAKNERAAARKKKASK
jgi:hypothetical protein